MWILACTAHVDLGSVLLQGETLFRDGGELLYHRELHLVWYCGHKVTQGGGSQVLLHPRHS